MNWLYDRDQGLRLLPTGETTQALKEDPET